MVLNTANVTDTLKKCIVNINYRYSEDYFS